MTPFGALVIDVLGGNIRVTLAGSNYAVTYHKPPNSPQLLAKTHLTIRAVNPLEPQHRCSNLSVASASEAIELPNQEGRREG